MLRLSLSLPPSKTILQTYLYQERITPRSFEKAEDFRWKLLSAVTQIMLEMDVEI